MEIYFHAAEIGELSLQLTIRVSDIMSKKRRERDHGSYAQGQRRRTQWDVRRSRFTVF